VVATLDKKTRAEFLRSLETVCQPDPRSHHFGIPHDAGPYGGKAFEAHHNCISAINLHSDVPEDVIIQFETAKNIYLYAWFVYRFYPVSQIQAYACLEFAMRERFEQEMVTAGWKKREFGFTLRNYLTYAATKGYIQNEDFEVWRQMVRNRARDRHYVETCQKMERLGLAEMEVDESKIKIKEEDKVGDYVGTLLESIPYQRNHFAHGSKTLHNTVDGTFRIVSEIINKLWPVPG
jgi:hypothetical protein